MSLLVSYTGIVSKWLHLASKNLVAF